MKIYTKNGDSGYSKLYNGIFLEKTSIYFTILGDIDELNCHIGMAKAYWEESGFNTISYSILTEIQCIFMDISKLIGSPPWHKLKPIRGDVMEVLDSWVIDHSLNDLHIPLLEKYIDFLESQTPPIKEGSIPGTNKLVSSLHICRAVAKRCERHYNIFLQSDLEYYGVYSSIDHEYKKIQIYLNRVSDLFFVLSRFVGTGLGVKEEIYSKSKGLTIFNKKTIDLTK
jgi:cob(I)alamin adenosyltransferase